MILSDFHDTSTVFLTYMDQEGDTHWFSIRGEIGNRIRSDFMPSSRASAPAARHEIHHKNISTTGTPKRHTQLQVEKSLVI